MAYREYFETEEYYLLRFDPVLDEQQLAELPNPYIGHLRNRMLADCSDITDSGWPYSAQVQTEYSDEPLIALNKNSLVLTALSGFWGAERRNRLDTIPHIAHLALMDYVSKIAEKRQDATVVASV